jgi:hypothetical protein
MMTTISPPSVERLHRLDQKFAHSIDRMHEQLGALLACEPFRYSTKPSKLPKNVVYLFSENDAPLYVGRSNRFDQRLGNHCRRSSQPNQSSFAFRLAREAASRITPEYKGDGTRRALMEDPIFAQGFTQAKVRLNKMEIRFVEQNDQVQQALLEIYCAVALGTPYNDFSTH